MDQPLTRRERIARERAAEQAKAAAAAENADETFAVHPDDREPSAQPSEPAAPEAQSEAPAQSSADSPYDSSVEETAEFRLDQDEQAYESYRGQDHTPDTRDAGQPTPYAEPTPPAQRPFVRPAERDVRSGYGSGPQHYGSGPQHYGSGPQHAAAGAAGASYAAQQSSAPYGGGQPYSQHSPQHYGETEYQQAPPATTAESRAVRRKPEKEPLGFVRGTIRGFGELCITAGLVLILFVVWQLWWTDIEANKDNQNLAGSLTDKWRDNPYDKLPEDPDTPVPAAIPEENQAFGIMYIPRFGDNYYRTIAEGVSLEPVLNRMGMGHYPSTARPGDVGNFAMAGHRVTYGKPLNLIAEMQPGDRIYIQTKEGIYTYTFRNYDITLPDATEVLAPVPSAPEYKGKDRIMTLTACNPMFSARERYIAYATLTGWTPAGGDVPKELADSAAFKKAGGQ